MSEDTRGYDPGIIEDKLYAYWENEGLFSPDRFPGGTPFSIVIPPPNVTGSLHMGHALNVTLQDVLARWKRMKGCTVLWLPGTDHAGIATQNVVERQIAAEGMDRSGMGRDAFIETVWKWKAEYGGRIIHQLKKLGASCDWTRTRFTMDDGLSKAVREVFVRLFEEGLIYRDSRLINWCPRCHTALSDLEVEYEETEGRLYSIDYPFANAEGHMTVATTRPETMLGDTAVAVHPEDERYRRFIGKMLMLPLAKREIPVVAEPTVDPGFGTGAVKVTPAHDFNDETIGRRHNLAFLSVISEDAVMTAAAGERYDGLDRYACRKTVLNDLRQQNLLSGEKKHVHAVGNCYRCRTVIEPLMTLQWYVDIKPLARKAVDAVREKKIAIIPDTWENNYFAWMKDIRDWCISRQIWWGHQIPVWYCPECMEQNGNPQGNVIEHVLFDPVWIPDPVSPGGKRETMIASYAVLRSSGLAHAEIMLRSKTIRIPKTVKPVCGREDPTSCPVCGNANLIRDPDVLDTWFSSALWPFSTLGWPDDTMDLRTFYPTSVLVTGFDILFFWVARMIMAGMHFMGDVPFRDVYIHALVRDQQGHKMSKSKGNVIDPLVIIERYGADAFRFTLAAFAAQGRDIRFSEERVEGYRHFINKLWNAARFILPHRILWTRSLPAAENLDLPSRWILSRLSAVCREVDEQLAAYRFNDAAGAVYQFAWHEFCDWYVEIAKTSLYGDRQDLKERTTDVFLHVFDRIVRLLHPFMPFVTEELRHSILGHEGSIMFSQFPESELRFPDAERDMGFIIEAVSAVRSIRGEMNIPPSRELIAFIRTNTEECASVIRDNAVIFRKLTRCSELTAGTDVERRKASAVSVGTHLEVSVPVEGLFNVAAERKRLLKEEEKLRTSLFQVNRKLMNDDFLRSAPSEVITKEKNKAQDLSARLLKVQNTLTVLKTMESQNEVKS